MRALWADRALAIATALALGVGCSDLRTIDCAASSGACQKAPRLDADAGPGDPGDPGPGDVDGGLGGDPDPGEEQEWWDAAWPRRIALTFAPGVVTETLTDFVMAVVIEAQSPPFDSATLSIDGKDVRFVAQDHESPLDHEIEHWDPAGRSILWVRIPSLEPTTSRVWMYFGHTPIDQSRAPPVWVEPFVGVWHFTVDFEAADPVVRDRTVNLSHGALVGMDAGADVSSPLGRALAFDGVDDLVDFGDRDIFELPVYTYSIWIRGDAAPGAEQIRQPLWNAEDQFQLNWDHFTDNARGGVGHRAVDDWEMLPLSPEDGLAAETWYAITATFDGTTLAGYLDGALVSEQAAEPPLLPVVGALIVGGDPGRPWAGRIDELRVASVARSAAWIAAEHASTNQTLFAWGTVEKGP